MVVTRVKQVPWQLLLSTTFRVWRAKPTCHLTLCYDFVAVGWVRAMFTVKFSLPLAEVGPLMGALRVWLDKRQDEEAARLGETLERRD